MILKLLNIFGKVAMSARFRMVNFVMSHEYAKHTISSMKLEMLKLLRSLYGYCFNVIMSLLFSKAAFMRLCLRYDDVTEPKTSSSCHAMWF